MRRTQLALVIHTILRIGAIGTVLWGFLIPPSEEHTRQWWLMLASGGLIAWGTTSIYFCQEYAERFGRYRFGWWYGKPWWIKFTGTLAIVVGISIIALNLLGRVFHYN